MRDGAGSAAAVWGGRGAVRDASPSRARPPAARWGRGAHSPSRLPHTPHPPPLRFTVVWRSPDASVEIRDYAPSTWATTTVDAGTPFPMMRADGFRSNLDYITRKGFPMTAPVVYRIGPPGTQSTASFLISPDLADTAQSDGAVNVQKWPAMRVAARSFVGPIDGRGLVDRQATEAALAAAKGNYIVTPPNTDPFYFVGYDGPNTPIDKRRSEVWLPVQSSPPPTAAPAAQALVEKVGASAPAPAAAKKAVARSG